MTGLLKLKLIGLVTSINLIIGVAIGSLLYYTNIDHYFSWYPSIPIFYWLTSVIMINALDSVKRKNGDVTVTTYMVFRLLKFMLTIIFLMLYTICIAEHLRAFSITLVLFYFIYLALETYAIYLFEKKRMKREKREHDERFNR